MCIRDRDPKKKDGFLQKQSELVETIEILEEDLKEVSDQRKAVGKHVLFEELPEKEQFKRLAPGKKQLVDTIKMIAYRAETALSMIIKPSMRKSNEARTLIRAVFESDADLLPDLERKELRVRIHHMATPRENRAVQDLLDHLNESEFVYPGTELKLRYVLGCQGEDEFGFTSNS